MGFTNEVHWSGQSLTIGELREFVRRAADAGDEAEVEVQKEPVHNHPTDFGGTIRLTVTL